MKKVILFSTCIAAAATMAACGGPGAKGKAAADTAAAETKAVPEYTVINNATIDLSGFPQDKDGYYVIFDGKTFNGWRGYGKDHVPSKWTIDNGAIKFNGSGGGEAQDGDGGDLIFTHKFKNFELEVEWKVAKGSNSGIFYLGQEVATTKDGKQRMEPIYISCPEYQVLDNENHPDAKLGVDGNRKSASLYDMIPAVPQNANRGTRPERPERARVPPLDSPVDGDARKEQVQPREVAPGIRTAEQLRRCTARRLHRLPGSRRRCMVPQHPHQGARLIPLTTVTYET